MPQAQVQWVLTLEAEGNVMSGAGVVSVVLPKRRQAAV
jgi:hypothetical protein